MNYPVARKSDIADNYHGVRVADPYRWLENPDSPQTRKWIEAENKLTQSYLSQVPNRDQMKKRLAESM